MDAILVPGGFGKRGVEGKIAAIRYARENGIPYLGICLGMQLAVIEYARHKAGLAGANSTEFDPDDAAPGGRADHRVAEPRRLDRAAHARIRPGRHDAPRRAALRGRAGLARAPDLRRDDVSERHRHRYEVNNHYLPRLEAAGLVVGAWAKSAAAGDLCEMIELPQHPWFFGCQFHPEFTSKPRRGHPLFIELRARRARAAAAGAGRRPARGRARRVL